MPEQIQDKKVFSLLEVAKSIQKTLVERYTSSFWIRAEMNKLNAYAHSGHCFPELVEKKEGRLIAELKSLLWRDDYTRINARFLEILNEPLKDGITILFEAKIQFDPVYGLTLRITDIDPWYSLGELEKEKQVSINRLKQEGVFALNKMVPLPLLPKRIAIISVESSKGYSDFMKVMKGNSWDYTFFFMLFPAFLQGDKAAASIIYQLERIKQVAEHFDVVTIIRGGGGDVGLTCYNNYELSRAIATYPLPVLTGIGHSTNETVAEMVAYKNAITPTELADFLLQQYHDFSVPLQDAEELLIQKVKQLIADEQTALINMARILKSVSRSNIAGNRAKIDYASRSLLQDSRGSLARNLQLVLQSSRSLSRAVILSANRQRSLLSEQTAKLAETTRSFGRNKQRDLLNIEKVISVMSPDNVLKRGYSITMVNGRLARSANDPRPGDQITTILQDGTLNSTVTASSKNTNNE